MPAFAPFLRKLRKRDSSSERTAGLKLRSAVSTAPSELALMNLLSDYPNVLASSANELAPHSLVAYLSDLASKFHSFCNSERVLVEDEKTRNARLALLLAVQQVFKNGLGILGGQLRKD